MSPRKSDIRNNLLAKLSDADFERFSFHLEPQDLPRGLQIATPNESVTHYYFHEAGIASTVSRSPEGHSVEVGLVGRDGLAPTAAILHCDSSPHATFVQVAGYGHRIEARAFSQLLDSSADCSGLFRRYVHTLWTQSTYTALSNAMHHVEERLARWILMCHDRVDGDRIELTHDFIAVMLGVRRPSVTTALHLLEGNKLIYSERGIVTVRDRRELEVFAADAYGIPDREYARVIGQLDR